MMKRRLTASFALAISILTGCASAAAVFAAEPETPLTAFAEAETFSAGDADAAADAAESGYGLSDSAAPYGETPQGGENGQTSEDTADDPAADPGDPRAGEPDGSDPEAGSTAETITGADGTEPAAESVPVADETEPAAENVSGVDAADTAAADADGASEPVPESEEEDTKAPAETDAGGADSQQEEDLLFSAAASVEEGAYAILSARSSGYGLDIKGSSFTSGGKVQLYQHNRTTAQIFFVKKTSDGYYTIQAANSGLYLNVKGAKAENGNTVQQYRNDGSKAVKWQFVPTGKKDGSFYIQFYNTKFVLDIKGAQYANGSAIQLYRGNRTAAQRFLLVPASVANGWNNYLGAYRYVQDGSYLKNQEVDGLYVGGDGSPLASVKNGVYVLHAADRDGLVLDVEKGSSANRANIRLFGSNATGAQRFRLTSKGNGYYTIVNAASGKAVEPQGGIRKAGRNVCQNKQSGSQAQLWRAMKAGPDGESVKFVCCGTTLCLSRAGHGERSKTNVVLQYGYAEGDSWNLVKSVEPTVLKYGRETYQIVSAANTKQVIGVKDAGLSKGAAIRMQGKNGNACQHFRLHKDGAYVRIQAEHSAKYLNVQGGKSKAGQEIIQYIHDGTKASLFRLVPVSEKSNDYYLQFKDTDYVIGIRGGKASNGASLELQKKTGAKTQLFRFVRSNSTAGRNTAAVRAENILNRVGWTRRPAFDYAKVPYQTFDTNEYNGLEWNANYGYLNRRGNCFIRAAQFCMLARVMGDEAYLIRGYVPAPGRNIRHGWVEIETAKGPRVFDVSYNSYGYPNTYDVAYGQKGTYRYTIQGRVE